MQTSEKVDKEIGNNMYEKLRNSAQAMESASQLNKLSDLFVIRKIFRRELFMILRIYKNSCNISDDILFYYHHSSISHL